MPVVSLSAIKGKDIPSLIESLERQRKELEFILSSLDNDNVLELSGDLINQGLVQAQHVQIGANTTFEAGYDPTQLSNVQVNVQRISNDLDTLESVVSAMELRLLAIQEEVDLVEVDVATLQTDLVDLQTNVISPIEVRLTEAEADIIALQGTP